MICLDKDTDSWVTSYCGESVHRDCRDRWLTTQTEQGIEQSCPKCRRNMPEVRILLIRDRDYFREHNEHNEHTEMVSQISAHRFRRGIMRYHAPFLSYHGHFEVCVETTSRRQMVDVIYVLEGCRFFQLVR